MSRLLLGVCLAALVLSASAQMMRRPRMMMPIDDEDDFDSQGLEVLEGRYGQAYPGYAGAGSGLNYGLGLNQANVEQLSLNAVNNMMGQQSFGTVGVGEVNWAQQGPAVSLAQIPQVQNLGFQQTFQQQPIAQFAGVQNWQQQIPQTFGAGMIQQQPDFSQEMLLTQQNLAANAGLLGSQLSQQNTLATTGATTVMPSYGLSMPTSELGSIGQMGSYTLGSYGGIGALGAGAAQLGTSKKTTTAQPIYAQSMVVPKIIKQPILRPHTVTQPILQQHLIQQPIVETRQVIQPVIRRIITQPIIRPYVYESTTIQPTLKTETTVQPHIVQQTVVTPQIQNQYEEQQPITEAPKTTVAAPVVQPTVSAKKQSGGLGGMMAGLF